MQTLFTPALQTADMGSLKPNPPGNSVSTEPPESFARVFEASQREATTPQPETPKPETAPTSLDAPVIPQPEQTPSSAEAPPVPLFIQASIQSLLLNLPEPEDRTQSETALPAEPVQDPQITALLLKGLSKAPETPLPTEDVQTSATGGTQGPSVSTTDTANATENTATPAPEQTEQKQSRVSPSPAAEVVPLPVTAEIPPSAPIPQIEHTKAVEQARQTDAAKQSQTVSQTGVATSAAEAEPKLEQTWETESEQKQESEPEKEQETDSQVRTFVASPRFSTQQTSSDLPVLKQAAQMGHLASVSAQAVQPSVPSLPSASVTRQDHLQDHLGVKIFPSDQGLESLQPGSSQTAPAPTPELAPSLPVGPSHIPLMSESPNTQRDLALPFETPPRPATAPENLRFAPLGERIRLLRQAGQSQMRLNLQPAELGRVSLQIVQKEQELHLHIFTDTVMAKELLESQIGQLKQSLMQQGLHLQQCQIEVNPEHNEHSGQGFSHERPPQQTAQTRSQNLPLDWDEAEFELDLSALPLPQPDANHVNYLA
ncbi:MAG: flagellar hook-length control protein FliK [Candidatus Sericytochromatia bacterium]|nr:flagellar hook-length control protein FliK [Candidatus Sericytochromatia bacterium]